MGIDCEHWSDDGRGGGACAISRFGKRGVSRGACELCLHGRAISVPHQKRKRHGRSLSYDWRSYTLAEEFNALLKSIHHRIVVIGGIANGNDRVKDIDLFYDGNDTAVFETICRRLDEEKIRFSVTDRGQIRVCNEDGPHLDFLPANIGADWHTAKSNSHQFSVCGVTLDVARPEHAIPFPSDTSNPIGTTLIDWDCRFAQDRRNACESCSHQCEQWKDMTFERRRRFYVDPNSQCFHEHPVWFRADHDHRGIGDAIEALIKKFTHGKLQSCLGCRERRDALNAVIPFKK